MSSRAAALFTAVGIVLAFFSIGLITDFTPSSVAPQHTTIRIAAVAIRDNVIPFQKFGSKLFTVPAIEKAYDVSYYVTDRGTGRIRGEFLGAIRNAAAQSDYVDLFLLAHSNKIVFWVESLPIEVRRKLRMVYNTGCGDAYQAKEWRALGVRSYVGHPGRQSVSPLFYVYFLRRWIRGQSVYDATRESNRKMFPRVRAVGGPASGFRFDGITLAAMSEGMVTGDLRVRIR